MKKQLVIGFLLLILFCSAVIDCQADEALPIPENTAPQIALVENGACSYTMIRADVASKETIQASTAFRNAFLNAFHTAPKLTTDWIHGVDPGETVPADPNALQILIGDTNRAETAAVRERLVWENGYIIAMEGKSLVLLGTSETMTIKAMEDFAVQYLQPADGFSLPADFSITYNFATDSIGAEILGQFRVICGNRTDRTLDATKTLSAAVGYQNQAGLEKAIVVGSHSTHPNSVKIAESLDYLDYTISVSEKEILLVGGSPLSTCRAVDRFLDLYSKDALGKLSDGFTETFDFSEYRADSLLYHVEDFVPAWADRFTTPEWMLDFEEKSYAITAANGRLLSDSHRGDCQNYPENSLEAIYSAILLGADCIEIDVRLTADHVPVLMHDATLERTTNWLKKRGKNGLPSSPNVEDWSYAQLMELNLTHNGEVTAYKIPTAYEAVALCANRCFIDWDCKVELDVNSDVYLLAEELGAKASFYFYFSRVTMDLWNAKDKEDAVFNAYSLKMAKYLSRSGSAIVNRRFALLEQNGDSAAGWNACYAQGFHMVYSDKTEDLCRYIAKTYQPMQIPNS